MTKQFRGIRHQRPRVGTDDDAASSETFPDPDDRVFYEVALSHDDSYVVTGNLRHFPKTPIKESAILSPI